MNLSVRESRILKTLARGNGRWQILGFAASTAKRLAEAGLLDLEPLTRELGGVTYSITEAGRAALELPQ